MRNWIAFGQRIVPLLVTCIDLIERWVTSRRGQDKQDSAVALLMHMLNVIETSTDTDLVSDEAVDLALRSCIDSIVSVQNAIADAKARRSAGDDPV